MELILRSHRLILAVLLAASMPVFALTLSNADPEAWRKEFTERDIKEHADLKFDIDPKLYENQFSYVNKLFLPRGTAPFPLVVILPSCGGPKAADKHLLEESIRRGYAAYILDSLRGAKTNCLARESRPVKLGRLTKDAYDLLENISKVPQIDPSRVFSVGGSLGGMVGSLLASPTIKSFTSASSLRYRANASFYGCGFFPAGVNINRPDVVSYFINDTDRPLLWLSGERDTECLVDSDAAMAKFLADRKLPIEFHLLKGATHCWDCSDMNGFSKTMKRTSGSVRVDYRYDKAITEDSISKTFEFFGSSK